MQVALLATLLATDFALKHRGATLKMRFFAVTGLAVAVWLGIALYRFLRKEERK